MLPHAQHPRNLRKAVKATAFPVVNDTRQRSVSRSSNHRWILVSVSVVCAACCAAATAGAAGSPPLGTKQIAARLWRTLTTNDLRAARALLLNDDPAAAPAVGDEAFITNLRTAYGLALAQAKSATGYPGYIAVLGQFANSLGDGHVWIGPRYVPGPLQWAGIIFRPALLEWAGLVVVNRQGRWVIAKQDANIVRQPLVGARLLDCGALPIAKFARRTLASLPGVIWSDQAMRVLAAPWVLIDDGNPFVRRPNACRVRIRRTTRRIALHWKPVSRDEFHAMIRGTVHGRAGFGLRKVGSGYWIALQSLTARAQRVIDVVKAHEELLRAAPYVVVDLRGNGGGDSAYGRALAADLYGRAHVDSILGPNATGHRCSEVWRASPANIAAVEASARAFEAQGDIAGAKAYRAAVAAMRTALAQHRALTAPPRCTVPHRPSAPPVPSLVHGYVIVLTDSVCFSSCVTTVGYFKRLGATLVGQSTGAVTHFSEERIVTLPSGLARLSLLMALMPDQPPQIGPYAPSFPYFGNISNTAALERWIEHAVVPALHQSRDRATR